MKFEFSAGGVVYKKEGDRISILLAQHALHHGWVFPKGLIGDTIEKESKEDTAVREVKEETGFDAEIEAPLTPVTYWYQFEGQKIKKTVYYFIMKLIGGSFEEKDDEMENVEWLEFEKVESRLTYPSDKKVWEEAREHIQKK
jgi:8-oxo-dGTP diphosphatase